MRIGVVADTHCPEFLPELPAALLERLEGVEMILHAGDVGGVGGEVVLRQLEEIAPVVAVRGDHDAALTGLPLRTELTIAGRRIGLIHGNRTRLIEEPVTFWGTITLGSMWLRPGQQGWLRRQFPAADVIVYGHTHAAAAERVDGALLLNPGPVYVVSSQEAQRRLERGPGWFERGWLEVIRHRRDEPTPSVGILELTPTGVEARIEKI
jgi:putative phosphoesterase